MWGSDQPVFYMRGRRRWEGDRYINLTSGDYSWNTNREPPEVEATYTLMMYEAMRALKDVCRELDLPRPAVEAIFHRNAHRLIQKVLEAKRDW